jgi:hypothetical protein
MIMQAAELLVRTHFKLISVSSSDDGLFSAQCRSSIRPHGEASSGFVTASIAVRGTWAMRFG